MSEALFATIGEALLSDHSVHEPPGDRASDPEVDLVLTIRIKLLEVVTVASAQGGQGGRAPPQC